VSSTQQGSGEILSRNVRANVRALRAARGWSTHDVAKHGGPSAASVSRLERDPSSTRLSTLSQVAHAFGLPVAALFWDLQLVEPITPTPEEP
jgi:transcriptional regulator with XRE-family HTH domain